MKEGVLSDVEIRELINSGAIISKVPIDDKNQVQPSSMDLRCGLGKNVWRMDGSTIPNTNMEDYLKLKSRYSFSLEGKKGVLDRGLVYIIRLAESFDLPEGISARANPKSTTGRWDIHARLLTEKGDEFDNVRSGYKGKLYLEVISQSFDLEVPSLYTFVQARFIRGSRDRLRLNQGMLKYLARSETLLVDFNGNPIPSEKFIRDGVVGLTLNLRVDNPGYVVRHDAPLVDLSALNDSLDGFEYFNKVNLTRYGCLSLESNSFYLLTTNEGIVVPSDHCAEMEDSSAAKGEFRVHYAGFFDPGFGNVRKKGKIMGAQATLEVRNTSPNRIILNDGQNIADLRYNFMASNPSRDYSGNYQGQRGVRGPKQIHF